MELIKGNRKLEELNKSLNDEDFLKNYKLSYDDYKTSFLPNLFGNFLIICGNIIYGKKPTYNKFRSIEIIARVPYYSWVSASYTLMTLFFNDEKKAIELSALAENSIYAQENETMHVVVISHICQKEAKPWFLLHTFIPMFFAFMYFWISYILYFINKKYAYELNYIFENHAFLQYDEFLKNNSESLKHKKIHSDFLEWYGRNPISQYDFFLSIRNDEIIHRNHSIDEIRKSGF